MTCYRECLLEGTARSTSEQAKQQGEVDPGLLVPEQEECSPSRKERKETSGHTAAPQPARGKAILFPGRSDWLCNAPQNHAGLYKHSCFSRQKYFHSSPSIRQGTCLLWPAAAETNPQGERSLQQWSPAAPLRKAVNPRGGCSQLQRETDLRIHSATSERQARHDGDQRVPQLQPPTKAGSPVGPKDSQGPMCKSSRSRLKGNLRNQFPDPHLALALFLKTQGHSYLPSSPSLAESSPGCIVSKFRKLWNTKQRG